MREWILVVLVVLVTSVRCTENEDFSCTGMDVVSGKGCTFDDTWCEWNNRSWTFLYGSTDPELFTSCDFSRNCGYSSEQCRWSRHSSENYIYVDTSACRGRTAQLLTPEFPASPTDICLQFWYYTFAGVFSVKLQSTNDDPVLLKRPAHTWATWSHEQISIPATKLRRPFKLVFEGSMLYSGAEIRVDDVITVPKPCPAFGDCSFEVFCSAWPTSMDGEGDRDKWRLAVPPHHGRQIGPRTDHTFGNGQHGRYLYFSAERYGEKSHYFQSKYRPTAKCMSFWFCTKGTSRLIVQRKNYHNYDWQDVWDSDFKDTHLQWTYASAMLSPGYFPEIRIKGVTYTTTGVVAIDDIRFHNASCPEDGMKKHGAVVKMSDWNLNHFAVLNSYTFCPTRDAFYFLVVNYTVNCEDGMCMLAVVQRALNNSAVFLWNTTEYSNKTQTQKIKIASRDDYFWITIGARKINTYGWSLEILVDSVSFEFGGLLTSSTAETTTTLLTQQSTISGAPDSSAHAASPDTSGNRGEDNSDNGLAVGVGVSMAVIVVVVVVITVIVCRRRNNSKDGNKDGNAGILNCWKSKLEPASESIQPGVANATYAPDSDPDSVHLATNDVGSTYAKVNKPKKGGDVYSVPNKGPKAAASRGAANSDVYHELEGDGAEADHYSVPNDADSSKRKGDNGYELAAAKLSMAPNTTPRNAGLNKAKGSVGSKTSRGFNPGAEREDEYNKLSLQTPRVASPAMPDTDNTYNHLDEHKHGVPTDQTGGNEYSLAKPDEAVSSKSTGNSRRQDYVNVNPNTSPREDEYHNLDFDSGHAPNSAIRSTGTTGGQDEYNHLQADGPGFKVQGEDDHYNALDFDSHGQVQKGDDGMVYSHLDDDQSAV